MQTRKKALKNSAVLFLATLLIGCGEPALFDQFKAMPNNAWHQDSVVTFVVDVEDTVMSYYPSIRLRHNADYAYANLYMFRKISSSSGLEYQDTIDLLLADTKGKWLGNGFGEIKTMEWGYGKGGLRFTHKDKYTFTLQQGMRDSLLIGIMDVGLHIVQIKNQEE